MGFNSGFKGLNMYTEFELVNLNSRTTSKT